MVQGGLITGTITGGGNALKKVKVLFRNAFTKKPAGATKTNKDGVYNAGDIGLTVSQGRTYLAGLSVKF